MSTLNVANISDDQSTLTGSGSNLNDKLHFNTTVDTKFVTNGSAKAFGAATSAGGINPNIGATLNISSTQSISPGEYRYSFANSMVTFYAAVSDVAGGGNRRSQIAARETTYVQITVRDGNGTKTDTSSIVVVHGELA
jgi:hypothetical protein